MRLLLHSYLVCVVLHALLLVNPARSRTATAPGDVAALVDLLQLYPAGAPSGVQGTGDPCGSLSCGSCRDGDLAQPSCNWRGISCKNGRICLIDLSCTSACEDPLQGQLPDSLVQLGGLQLLDLGNNALSGTLPTAWADWGLQVLSLDGNRIGGALSGGDLPPEWGNMPNITRLALSSNKLGGPLPASWGAMSTLQQLDLSDNSLTGTVPSSWANMTQLRTIDLLGNSAMCVDLVRLPVGTMYSVPPEGASCNGGLGRVDPPPLPNPPPAAPSSSPNDDGGPSYLVRIVITVVLVFGGILACSCRHLWWRRRRREQLEQARLEQAAAEAAAADVEAPANAGASGSGGVAAAPEKTVLPVFVVMPDGQQVCFGRRVSEDQPDGTDVRTPDHTHQPAAMEVEQPNKAGGTQP